MHIPDGYLSPSTCAVLYAGATPFWVIALKRVRRALSARLVPLLSLVAAFSFVVMMFNLPLPGGTTGHAVGMGIAAIVLGPWASIIAISVALLIQAIFFGDGGITAYGANCLNMAIIGSLVAHLLYRLISGRTPVDSPRRVFAAGVAGYLAINVAALCAAVEFGIQPALFHDASGAPLYAPYPLSIAVPAMLIGHLTFAGLAECVISAGVVAYLQRANPSLLQATAGSSETATGWRMTRPLWLGLAALMILTPLGLLAAGTAWGEWGVEDFKDPKAREQMAVASHNLAPPAEAPKGLERLSSIWTAPMPDYAPPFLKSKGLGYVLSAMAGTGLIILACLLIDALLRPGSRRSQGSLAL
ncbi:MAG: cobalt transporter CbiM [Verrucomicrobia bacterium]|nr:cobalt transporter CbiM [Verrucomicrobiota bacterium]